ncbi:ribonuclease P protein component [Patescibacteria group bacterium]
MLPRSRKISRDEFPQDFHSGYKFHSDNLFLLTIKQKDPYFTTKFSFVVSKKVSKSAVKRILLKRRGYNVVENLINGVKPGFLCVFHLKKGAEVLKYKEINDQIVDLLKKAKILD